ncbi:hypothetical protein A3F00_01950 [Candidatus Daviesbacteria bacterium RIFCSPHIGHO2_12_FULL_37_11]|uniref:SprT-like domain-containing protein n=1 Tax=Candidatus Daviesbacteria bacterium RIFCSPHIGHO2_12_FULL_37_11 TaxID=1797777 RepID=A0A1F5KEC3_9BACT|nr:MAG: hypothetical protein A3F00_01950 [Candidatus Daviesbacteria bacterium RIFCSPHIGHO2_12_FULL_37_11]
MRNDIWLLSRLDYIWSNFFPDVLQENKVFIRFGRFSRFRLGSIKMDRRSKSSHITITSMFKDENIPALVIDHTIAHELCHYTHGFSSPKAKLHKYPHHGGVIRKELEDRGLQKLVIAYASWKKSYREILSTHRLRKRVDKRFLMWKI